MTKSKYIFLLFLLTTSLVQTAQTNKTKDSLQIIGEYPEEIAAFPGGFTKFAKYINDNVSSNVMLTKEEIEIYRKPYAKFLINENGQVDSVKIIRSSNVPRLDELFLKALLNMPNWTPSKLNGKAKRQEFNFPLTLCFK
jgi:TonB family protein